MSIFRRFTGGAPEVKETKESKKKKNLHGEFSALLMENLQESKEEYSEEDYPGIEAEMEVFIPMVQKALADFLPEKIFDEDDEDGERIPEDIDVTLVKNAMCVFHVSVDKMLAMACILPPINGGKEVSVDVLEKELRYAGLSFGIDKDLIAKIVKEQEYLYPFPVAEGKPHKDGKDGVVVDCFERKADVDIEVAEGAVIDFSKEISMQVVQKDAIICYIQNAERAVDGMDVVGNVLKGKDGAEVSVKEGENTFLSADGRQLISAIDGVISVTADGNFYVKPQRTVMGNVGRHTGNIYGKGDLYISGNVNGNIVVKADGDLIIGGEVTEAQLTAGGNVRIQKGIVKGKATTIIKAEGQVQASVIDGVQVDAGGSVYAEVIVDGKVTSGGSVYVNSDRGLIIGGEVKARRNVTAKEIGNISGCANRIWVGYEPELKQKIEDKKKDLKDSSTTLETLQKNISTLKAVGRNLPQDKKELLSKLEEQRALYEQKEVDLTQEIKQLTVNLRKSADGMVSCDKLYPTTEIFVGERSTKIQRQMEPCRVFVSGENIVAR